ncbi:MAG: phosphotransferase [Gemmatimonadota bacterium]|nr:MAG: phosphotransferase [Gemmatimonadota bacterium]
MKEHLITLFESHFGHRPEVILEMAADGSTRQYFRLAYGDDETAIGAIGPDREENRAFLAFAKAFRGVDLPVPEIYGENREAGVWLEQDLGDTTLFKALAAARIECSEDEFPPEAEQLYRKALTILPRFQVLGHEAVDYRVAYPRQAFDKQSIRWDLNYFKYHFLKLGHITFSEQRLEDDFSRLTELLLQANADYFLYRDFQSRNIMICSGEPWFIDFQGGRKGALQYDVASLLYDAKADIPQALRDALLEHYLDALSEYTEVDRAIFRDQYMGFVLVRLMQALGAFGYRGFFERKRHFLESVLYAAQSLDSLLIAGMPIELPELELVFRRIADRWAPSESPSETQCSLEVLVQSFSFKDGYPQDIKGHGGGYVFDCRGLPNPHDRMELRDLTGETEEVADFLEQQEPVQEYWENVRGIVESHVEDYVNRGLTSLTISFGCTGGKHRSVFMARKLVDHLATGYPHVATRLSHGKL